MKGILGRKAGMTHVFTSDGKAVPVTVVEVSANSVLQVKTVESDGYNAIKLGFHDKKESRVNSPDAGQFKKANSNPKYFVKEIRDMEGYEMGQTIDASIFEANAYVDVTGISKGKGFSGSIKRHNYTRGPMGHGSKYHRGSGSMGDIRGTVKKTKKLPGHMGHVQKTIQNLPIVKIDLENNAILIKGSIPGPNKSYVVIRESVKKSHLKTDYSLVNLHQERIKNELLEEGKKFGASINTSMSIEEMKAEIANAKVEHEANLKLHEELVQTATGLGITNPAKLSLDDLKVAVEKAQELEKDRAKEADAAKETKNEEGEG